MTLDCWKNSCHGATVVPDDRDDEQHGVGADAALDAGHDEVVGDRPPARVRHQRHREHDDAHRDEQEHGPLPAAETAGRGDQHQHQPGQRDGDVGTDAEVPEREGHADELRHDRQEVEHEEVTDAEPAPEPAEPLVDEPRMPDSRHGPEPDHHLLVDDQDRDQQEQRPQQAVAVILSRLGVGGHAAGVVVADHHDQAGPDDRQERQQTPAQAAALRVVEPDRGRARPRCRRGAPRRGRHSAWRRDGLRPPPARLPRCSGAAGCGRRAGAAAAGCAGRVRTPGPGRLGGHGRVPPAVRHSRVRHSRVRHAGCGTTVSPAGVPAGSCGPAPVGGPSAVAPGRGICGAESLSRAPRSFRPPHDGSRAAPPPRGVASRPAALPRARHRR